MQLIGAFIGIAIMLAIGIQILGNTISDCTGLPDYNSTNANTAEGQIGWASQCYSSESQAQSGYQLLGIILIVVAAVAILFVVKML